MAVILPPIIAPVKMDAILLSTGITIQKVISNGQIVIPVSLRRKYGIRKGSRVPVQESNGHIVVQPRNTFRSSSIAFAVL
jgi:AbrB family looped-hinge helix DNA binding protein